MAARRALLAFVLALTGMGLGAHAAERSCRAEVGEKRAQRYVRLCIEISPATRPPCNADNSCALITGEIQRSCALAGEDAPGWCAQFE